MSEAINKVAHKVGKLKLNVFKLNRLGGDAIRPVIDILATGGQKLKSLTLATFNRKVWAMMVGEGFNGEDNEIPQVLFNLSGSDEF